MKKIDNYCILAKKKYSDGWMFVDGYKSLPTLRKRFNIIKSVSHENIILCSRDDNKNILKIYDEIKGGNFNETTSGISD